MTITNTQDAFGRVTFNGLIGTPTILKNGITITPTITSGSFTDNRPQKNYQTVVTTATGYSFVGVEFCIRGKMTTAALDWDVTVTDSVLGNRTFRVQQDFSLLRGGDKLNQILWGISGLTLESHTVTIAIHSGGYSLANLSGYNYSDLSLPFGTAVTYNIAGTNYVVYPQPDRRAAAQSLVSRWIAGYNAQNYSGGNTFLDSFYFDSVEGPGNMFLSGYIAAVAGAYAMTGDSNLPTIAAAMFDRLLAISDPTTGLVNYSPGFGSDDIVDNGRVGHDLWYAYKIFGNGTRNYLAQAEKNISTFVNTWHKDAYGVWYDDHNGSSNAVITAINQRTAPAMGCALLYNEPASALYHVSSLQTTALANATRMLALNGITANGELPYNVVNASYPRIYGFETWFNLRYLRDNCGFTATNLDKVEGWLNNLPQTEPYFWIDNYYGFVQPCLPFMRIITDPATSKDYKDLFFSAAFADMNLETDSNNPDYNLTGFNASTAAFDASGLTYQVFYPLLFFKALGVLSPVPSKHGMDFMGCRGWKWLQAAKAINLNTTYGQLIQSWDSSLASGIVGSDQFWDDAYINSLDYLNWAWTQIRNFGCSYIRDFCVAGNMFEILSRGTQSGPAITVSDSDDWRAVDALVQFCFQNNMKCVLTLPELYDSYTGWSEFSNIAGGMTYFYIPYATYIANRYKAYPNTVIIEPRSEFANLDVPSFSFQAAIYNAVKSVSTLRVQLESCIYENGSGTDLTQAVRIISYLSSSGNINKFDDVFSVSFYPNVATWNGYTDLDAYVTGVINALASAGRTDVKIRLNEFGIFWSSTYGAGFGDPSYKYTKAPQAITDMFSRVDANPNIDSACYWAGAGCDVQGSMTALIAQVGAGLWRMDYGAPFAHYPTWDAMATYGIPSIFTTTTSTTTTSTTTTTTITTTTSTTTTTTIASTTTTTTTSTTTTTTPSGPWSTITMSGTGVATTTSTTTTSTTTTSTTTTSTTTTTTRDLSALPQITASYTTPDSHIVNIGYSAVCTISVSYLVVGVPLNQTNISTWPGLVSTWGIISGASSQYISCVMQIGISQDDTSGFVWQTFYPGQYIGQRFKMRLNVACNDPLFQTAIEIRKFTWTVDMPDKILSEQVVTSSSADTVVTYPVPYFQIDPNLQFTILAAIAGDDVKITSHSSTGFSFSVYNGIRVVRTVNWLAKGY